MCGVKDDIKTKIDRLIESIDRLTMALSPPTVVHSSGVLLSPDEFSRFKESMTSRNEILSESTSGDVDNQ